MRSVKSMFLLAVLVFGGLFIACVSLANYDWFDSISTSLGFQSQNVEPEYLIVIIKQKQSRYVKTSYNDYNCFTWDDLGSFRKSKIPTQVVAQLRTNKRFLALVKEINKMSPDDRQKLLNRASNTFKPLWSELGRIHPSGQTVAGRYAEQAISQAILELLKELSESSEKL